MSFYKNLMSIGEFLELLKYIQENHSFVTLRGKRIKYISPTYDTRTGRIFHVHLRLGGEGLHFSITNENKHRNLKDWIYEWLEHGTWESTDCEPGLNEKQ